MFLLHDNLTCCSTFLLAIRPQFYATTLYGYAVLLLVLLQVEKEKSLQIFVLQFVETFRDWGPHQIEQLVDEESGNNETVVGCSSGHPSEVILILIQEISLITSTFTESKWLYSIVIIYCVISSNTLIFLNS